VPDTSVSAKRNGTTLPQLSDGDLEGLDASFDGKPATAVLRWAVDTFGAEGLCVAFSGEDTVLIDIVAGVERGIEVVFIDTGYHFPETLETMERTRARYGLNLRVMTVPPADPPLWQVDPVRCCSEAKVAALDAALEGKLAWITGLRRVDAPTRAAAPTVGRDRRGLVKINPLATWSDQDMAGYAADHDLIANPLIERGYLSIGCAPCTRPVEPGADRRSGRWAGLDKTECGLHT
jgi:phosphoadenosine phosphosulfate reductase